MSDVTRGLRANLSARMLANNEQELRAVDAMQTAVEQQRDVSAPSPTIAIARDRLYTAATSMIDDELERAALAYAEAVRSAT